MLVNLGCFSRNFAIQAKSNKFRIMCYDDGVNLLSLFDLSLCKNVFTLKKSKLYKQI